ncbi:CbtB-domain containing protein [Pseudomonas qingdaonensis]|nr:CbtB-domain containing protein [Pseudomonas qingdaonensis]
MPTAPTTRQQQKGTRHAHQYRQPAPRHPTTLSQRLAVAIGASLLGLCLVYFAGFSHIEAVHNAAHDTRHSAAFPCH